MTYSSRKRYNSRRSTTIKNYHSRVFYLLNNALDRHSIYILMRFYMSSLPGQINSRQHFSLSQNKRCFGLRCFCTVLCNLKSTPWNDCAISDMVLYIIYEDIHFVLRSKNIDVNKVNYYKRLHKTIQTTK